MPTSKLASACPLTSSRFCSDPLPGQYNGTFSITSIGGVASTFLLEWFRNVEQAQRQSLNCKTGLPAEKTLFADSCTCKALTGGAPPRHLVSCHLFYDSFYAAHSTDSTWTANSLLANIARSVYHMVHLSTELFCSHERGHKRQPLQ